MKKILNLLLVIFMLCLTGCINGNYDTSWIPSTPDIPNVDKTIKIYFSSNSLIGKTYISVTNTLGNLGFYNIKYDYIFDLNGDLMDERKDGDVETVLINGDSYFDKGDTFNSNDVVIIRYHTLKINKPSTGKGYSFDFLLDNDGESYTLTNYNPDNYQNQPSSIVIPTNFLGLPVLSIGSYVFFENKSLKNITLPKKLVIIEGYAFGGCTNLEKINFPSTLETIEELAFAKCDSLKKIIFNSSVDIYHAAFYNCSGLSKIVIKESSSIIREYAFAECESLSIVNIPGVISIRSYAFQNSGVVTLTLDDGIYRIGTCAFSGCTKLKTIYIYGNSLRFDPTLGMWWDANTGNYDVIYKKKTN